MHGRIGVSDLDGTGMRIAQLQASLSWHEGCKLHWAGSPRCSAHQQRRCNVHAGGGHISRIRIMPQWVARCTELAREAPWQIYLMGQHAGMSHHHQSQVTGTLAIVDSAVRLRCLRTIQGLSCPPAIQGGPG